MLRSIRFGEADRVLHLYSADRGRVGAVAKGVRRVQVAAGGPPGAARASEPGAARGPGGPVHGQRGRHRARPPGHPRAPRLARAATQACESVLRLLDSGEANPPAFNLLWPTSSPCSTPSPGRPPAPRRWPSAPSCCWRRGSPPSWPRAPPAASASTSGASRPAPAAWSARAAKRAPSPSTSRPTGSWSRRWPGLWRRRPRHPTALWARPTAPWPRRRSTTPTSASGGFRPRDLRPRLTNGLAQSSSTTSRKGRATCATCSEARARTSPR